MPGHKTGCIGADPYYLGSRAAASTFLLRLPESLHFGLKALHLHCELRNSIIDVLPGCILLRLAWIYAIHTEA